MSLLDERAVKAIKHLRDENARLKKLAHVGEEVTRKTASVRKGRKWAEALENVPQDTAGTVKAALLEEGVSEDAAQQAANIVETAVNSAMDTVEEIADTAKDVTSEQENKSEMLSEAAKDSLAAIAADDNTEGEVKTAALALAKASTPTELEPAIMALIKATDRTAKRASLRGQQASMSTQNTDTKNLNDAINALADFTRV